MPAAQGMYDPAAEKDACGLAMVATLRGTAGHDIITAALDALRHLEHRGAVGSDAGTGDGAGIVTQVPDAFLREVAEFALPPAGSYAAQIDQMRGFEFAGDVSKNRARLTVYPCRRRDGYLWIGLD